MPATNPTFHQAAFCGISSFMMGVGNGALSRAFLVSIPEVEDGDQPTSPKATTRFEDFEEIRKLGEGAFGKVTLVKHKTSEELFAMKQMNKAKFKAQKITSKAISEQYILKTTRHKFIVGLHYAFHGSAVWVLVMEYCPNGDLLNYVVDHGTPGMTFFDTARLSSEVMLAIEHLHSVRVIFRDLKPENVVLDPKWRAKVTDFGLAKKVATEAEAKTMCGSYGYVAPEIMAGTRQYDYSVDLYSFGIMLYVLLSGGEKASNDPKQRLPPMKHHLLKRKLKDAGRNTPGEWAKPSVGALQLIESLTSDQPADRRTATSVKNDPFFERHLGRSVDSLMTETGCFPPGG